MWIRKKDTLYIFLSEYVLIFRNRAASDTDRFKEIHDGKLFLKSQKISGFKTNWIKKKFLIVVVKI